MFLSGPGCPSQSRRLLKEKKKSELLFTDSRNVSASLGNKRNEREHGSCRKSLKTVCPVGTKYYITSRKAISCPVVHEERGHGLNKVLGDAGQRRQSWWSFLTFLFIYPRCPGAPSEIPQLRHLQRWRPVQKGTGFFLVVEMMALSTPNSKTEPLSP